MQANTPFDDAYIVGFGSVKATLIDIDTRVQVLEKLAEEYKREQTEESSSSESSSSESSSSSNSDFVVVKTQPDTSSEIDKILKMIADIRVSIDDIKVINNKQIGGAIDYFADKHTEIRETMNERLTTLRNSIEDGLNSQSEATRENLDSVSKRIDVVETKADDAQSRLDNLRIKLREFAQINHNLLSKMQTEIENNKSASGVIAAQAVKIGEVVRDHEIKLNNITIDQDLINHLTERYHEVLDELKAIKDARKHSFNLAEMTDRIEDLEAGTENQNKHTSRQIDELNKSLLATNEVVHTNVKRINELQDKCDWVLENSIQATNGAIGVSNSHDKIRELVNKLITENADLRSKVNMLIDENVLSRHNALNNSVINMGVELSELVKRVDELSNVKTEQSTQDEKNSKSFVTVRVIVPPKHHLFRGISGRDTKVYPVSCEIISEYNSIYIYELKFKVVKDSTFGLRMKPFTGEWTDAMDNIQSYKYE
jgi:hypothetical protein